MNIKDFNVSDKKEKGKMVADLKKHKLENIKSLWYFVRAKSKATIVGSKS